MIYKPLQYSINIQQTWLKTLQQILVKSLWRSVFQITEAPQFTAKLTRGSRLVENRLYREKTWPWLSIQSVLSTFCIFLNNRPNYAKTFLRFKIVWSLKELYVNWLENELVTTNMAFINGKIVFFSKYLVSFRPTRRDFLLSYVTFKNPRVNFLL